MRAMWLGFAAAILIAIVAGIAMETLGPSSVERYSSQDTRL